MQLSLVVLGHCSSLYSGPVVTRDPLLLCFCFYLVASEEALSSTAVAQHLQHLHNSDSSSAVCCAFGVAGLPGAECQGPESGEVSRRQEWSGLPDCAAVSTPAATRSVYTS